MKCFHQKKLLFLITFFLDFDKIRISVIGMDTSYKLFEEEGGT